MDNNSYEQNNLTSPAVKNYSQSDLGQNPTVNLATGRLRFCGFKRRQRKLCSKRQSRLRKQPLRPLRKQIQ